MSSGDTRTRRKVAVEGKLIAAPKRIMRCGIPGVRRRWFAILTRCRIIHVSGREKALGIPKLLFDSDDFNVLKALDVENYEIRSCLDKSSFGFDTTSNLSRAIVKLSSNYGHLDVR